MDSVSARDFALETCRRRCATHLSRLAEEIVIFVSSGFDFFTLPDAFSTGSYHAAKAQSGRRRVYSRQNRSDIGRADRADGGDERSAFGLFQDMQEDKEGTFDALDSLSLALAAMTGMMAALEADTDAMRGSQPVFQPPPI